MELFFYEDNEYLKISELDETIIVNYAEILFQFIGTSYIEIGNSFYSEGEKELILTKFFQKYIEKPYILFLVCVDLEKMFSENDFDYEVQGIFYNVFEKFKGKTPFLDENTKLKYLKNNGKNIDIILLFFSMLEKARVDLADALQFCAGANYKNEMSTTRIKRYSNSRRFAIFNMLKKSTDEDYLKLTLESSLKIIENYSGEKTSINEKFEIGFICEGDVDIIARKLTISEKNYAQILGGAEFAFKYNDEIMYDSELIEIYKIDSLLNIMYLEIKNIINNNLKIKICKNCNKLFIPKNINAEYCDRIINKGRTCKDIGPGRKYQDKIAEDMVMQTYNRERAKRYMRNKRNPAKYDKEELQSWLRYAEKLKEEVREGIIEFDEYEELLSK